LTATLTLVVGPTASGKSELAIRLCQHIGGEIVNADSVQIYRRFDIGSAKPSPDERAQVPHHLVDELDPLDTADAARFAALAEARIADILARGKRPVVCGGTFLWVRALVYGLAEAPAGDAEIRTRHAAEAREHGREHLHARLALVDPPSHARLNPSDFVRVSRALEVYELTGTPLSELQARHGFRTPRYAVRLLGIRRTPVALDQRIKSRVEHMFEQGWLDEVRALCSDGYAEARALRSVGYRQIVEALQSGAPIAPGALMDEVVRATRVFVRRQMTWLRDQPVRWLEPEQLAPAQLDSVLATEAD
jgi:tRNA dimethylallyltransferase